MSVVLYLVSESDLPDSLEINFPALSQAVGQTHGLTFPASYKEAAIGAFGWPPDEVREVPTAEWSVRQLVRGQLPEPTVTIEYHDRPSDAWRYYLELVRVWCEDKGLTLPVVVHYSNGVHRPYESGRLHLCFGGTATFPIRVWFCERDVYYQSCHMWVGELGPEHGYCRALIPSLLGQFLPRMIGEVRSWGADKFVADGLKRARYQRSYLGRELELVRATTEDLQAQLVRSIREEQELLKRLSSLTVGEEEMKERLRQIFEGLANREYATSVQYRDGKLSVLTERILIRVSNAPREEDNGLYDIGEMRMEMSIDGTGGIVKVFNLTRQGPIELGAGKGPAHHPQTDGKGNICLGNMREVIPRHVAERHYDLVSDLLFSGLTHVNVDDAWGRTVTYWPRFSQQTEGSS